MSSFSMNLSSRDFNVFRDGAFVMFSGNLFHILATLTAKLCFLRDGPFSLQGGYGLFSKKNIPIPNVAEKNILILVEGKKSDSEFLSYNLM